MSIERFGQFIEFPWGNGVRYLARVGAIQLAADVDEMSEETYLTVAGRTILIRAPLEQVKKALLASA